MSDKEYVLNKVRQAFKAAFDIEPGNRNSGYQCKRYSPMGFSGPSVSRQQP